MKPTALTQAQKEQFHRDGCLILPRLIPAEALQALIEEINGAVDAQARRLYDAGEIPDTYANEGFKTRLWKLSQHTDAVFNALNGGVVTGPALFRFLTHPALLDMAESLVGPEIMCHPAFRVRPKMPHQKFMEVPWHQDGAHMAPECEDVLQLTVWIPLVEATVENGCMEALPGSHRLGGVLPHRRVRGRGYLDVVPPAMPDIAPVALPVPLGGVALLTNLTIHRSTPNRSDHIRWTVDVRYQDARQPVGFPPEAGFLARSQERPQEVVSDWCELERLRRSHVAGAEARAWPTEEPIAP